jgi:hypothetical protein
VRALQDLCNYNTIERKFHKKMLFIENFLCLFCNFRGSKPTRTRTQNTEKQRNGLIMKNKIRTAQHVAPMLAFLIVWYCDYRLAITHYENFVAAATPFAFKSGCQTFKMMLQCKFYRP